MIRARRSISVLVLLIAACAAPSTDPGAIAPPAPTPFARRFQPIIPGDTLGVPALPPMPSIPGLPPLPWRPLPGVRITPSERVGCPPLMIEFPPATLLHWTARAVPRDGTTVARDPRCGTTDV